MDGSGELSFEAADGFASCLAFGLFAFQVGACGWVDAALGDGDAVEGAVELAVAAAVEAVALVFARAGVEWCNAGVAGELSVGGEAVDRADLAEQLRRAQGSTAGQLEQANAGKSAESRHSGIEVSRRQPESLLHSRQHPPTMTVSSGMYPERVGLRAA